MPFTPARLIGADMTPPWFCALPLEVAIWAPIDMVDVFVDYAVGGRMGGLNNWPGCSGLGFPCA